MGPAAVSTSTRVVPPRGTTRRSVPETTTAERARRLPGRQEPAAFGSGDEKHVMAGELGREVGGVAEQPGALEVGG